MSKQILCSNVGCPRPAVMQISAAHPWFCSPCAAQYAHAIAERRPIVAIRPGGVR